MKLLVTHIIVLIVILHISQVRAQLVVSSGSSITVTSGTSLYVGTNLYIKSDVNGSGHLADQNLSGNTSITGDITIERYLTGDGWHNTSPPMANSNSSIFTGTDLIFYYDETIILNDWNFGWIWYDGPLSVMRGYDIFLPSTITTSYYSTTSNNLNTGSYSIDITRTNPANGEAENRKGWNFLGNPFPSPIDWLQESGWGKNDINDAKYIWNPDNNNYTIYLGGTNPTGINGATQYIPSNQGFWVQAIQNGSVQVNNTARVGVATATPGYYKSFDESEELRLIVSGNNYWDETLIRFIEGSTSNFDVNMDASKLLSKHDSVPQISSITGGVQLAINTLPEIRDGLDIPLNFSCATDGYYNIALPDNSAFTDQNSIYLLDKLDDKIIKLSHSIEYDFHHLHNNDENRFILFINPSDDIIHNHGLLDNFTISSHGNLVTIIRNTSELSHGKIHFYNLLGQNVYSSDLDTSPTKTIKLDLETGYYIASISIKNSIFNYKFCISQY